jgi:CheY-like chemotaxis protein
VPYAVGIEGGTLLTASYPGRLAVRGLMSRLRKTILCIDDHWNRLISRKMFLERNGYQVLEATSGDEGLKLFADHRVDAVVLDYQIPGMNGDVVAAKMKQMNSCIPILLLSAYGPLPKKKLESIDTFLTKSQEPTVLLSALEDMLTSRPKPFSHRWFDNWQGRHQGVRQ